MVFVRIPAHIGIIPDGNRRWAKGAGMEKQKGYGHGLQPGLALLLAAQKYGIGEITYYGFTTDNCHRPPAQIAAFSQACVDAVALIATQPVSLLVVGDKSSRFFPPQLLPYADGRVDIGGGGTHVNFLVNYGWEWDLATAGGQGRRDIMGSLRSREVSRIDLVIRWGGMRRLSGLLPVQSVYADFYVCDRLWPDFTPADLAEALEWYDKQDVTRGG